MMNVDDIKQELGTEGSNATETPVKEELKLKTAEPTISDERFEKEAEAVADSTPIEPPKKKIGLFKRLIKVLLLTAFCLVAFLGWDYVYNKNPFFKKKIDEKIIPYAVKKYKMWFPTKKEEDKPEVAKVKQVEPVKVEPNPVNVEPTETVVVEDRPVHRNYPSRPKPKTFDFSKVKSKVNSYLAKMGGEQKKIEVKRLNLLNNMIHTVIDFTTEGGGYSVRGGMKVKIYTSRGAVKKLSATSMWGNKNEMLVRRKGHETKKLKWSQLHLDSCIDILKFALKNQEKVLAGTTKRRMRWNIKTTMSELAFDLALIYDWYKTDPNAANSSMVRKYISIAVKNNKKMKKSCVFFFPNYMEKM